MRLDVVRNTLAKRVRVHADVEELGAELADDGEMDPVLHLREGIPADRDRSGTNGGETLVEFH